MSEAFAANVAAAFIVVAVAVAVAIDVAGGRAI